MGRAGAGGVRRRAEGGRPQHLADLRERAARPRRHAGRRVSRRGRDDERPDHPGHSAGAVDGRARADRGPGRGLHAAVGLRSHQPRARGARGTRLREPEERRGRRHAEPRPAGGGAARPVGGRLPVDRPGGPGAGDARRDARAASRVGPPGRGALAALCRAWTRSSRTAIGGRTSGARSPSTPTASSSSWTTWRFARASERRRSSRGGRSRSSSPRSRRRPGCCASTSRLAAPVR